MLLRTRKGNGGGIGEGSKVLLGPRGLLGLRRSWLTKKSMRRWLSLGLKSWRWGKCGSSMAAAKLWCWENVLALALQPFISMSTEAGRVEWGREVGVRRRGIALFCGELPYIYLEVRKGSHRRRLCLLRIFQRGRGRLEKEFTDGLSDGRSNPRGAISWTPSGFIRFDQDFGLNPGLAQPGRSPQHWAE